MEGCRGEEGIKEREEPSCSSCPEILVPSAAVRDISVPETSSEKEKERLSR